ncbi:hypothetical protein JQ038_17070 [Clostridium botulinum]|uniref:Uncharacterized protein n=1 Tax=Clostridium botulinum TaxID=1491 RepID=A0A6G4EG51_CLOBO|nr:hypothetical protein [Clostridium botulinum]APH18715.1 hypothetical protein NPD3_898 [Clostridium botulinum]AUM91774.1 hypothetical protein RSJ5_11025 [Clostridium botulinum]KEI78987.1 hypothetical protein N452_10390 [Clostridium botulinum A2 117]MBN3416220.1 hypothetical protein [Clostridium botulinum]MBN3442512.1 hypothetical protein [Clostridium botulinum]
MNQGQEKFLGFILERVEEDKVEEAKALLADNFKKQVEGNFTHDDITEFIPKMAMLLKPDKIEEVQTVMKQFAENFSH